jgi:vacuolar protein sorting-associated protein 29
MVLVLCIGDLHPYRAPDLPQKFKQLLLPGKIHRVLCTGNVCNTEMYDYLRSICGDVTVTQGDFDESGRWPDNAIVNVGQLRIGLCHTVVPFNDRTAAAATARRLGVDILVLGNSPEFSAYQEEGRLILHPGTATGAFSPLLPAGSPQPSPSFALMDVDGRRATIYVYELSTEEMKVDKIDFVASEKR